jgi:hypothetical protein
MNGYGGSATGTGSSSTQQNGYAYQNGHAAQSHVATTNGHSLANGLTNGHGNPSPKNGFYDRIACPDMGFYCFDVLHANLQNTELPKAPNFTNEAL